MRKLLLLILLFFSVLGFSQAITVNTSTYTVPQLVTDVLVNSPCAQARNVVWSTGTNFGSTNGIGYFQNTNPSFPLSSGVILSTGNVTSSPGPNNSTLSAGSAAWPGDAALQAALASAGITMNSINATTLEFDFTSLTTYFNFQFLFASEEYGGFQCQSPDAFAFLLTDSVTGITTNLAVIPSTTTPISVETIRNSLYNSGCPSANPAYFGSFNGGSAAAGSATDYNGQTVVMNASSSLVPNRTYHIKLVIADNSLGGTTYDSAIFLGGSSFIFAQDVLGPDVTVCNNDNVNQPYTIMSGLNPAQYSFVWKDAAGNPIPGETGPNLTVNAPGTYQLTYSIIASSCEVATNDIVITYTSAISTPDPVNLYKCNAGLPNYTYDLSYNTPIVDPSNQYQISYHDSHADAQANVNPLGNSITVASGSLPKTIWVRIFDPTTGCYTTKSFLLDLTSSPSATNPGTITECENAPSSGTASFNLAALTTGILNGQSPAIYEVTYHTSLADANGDASPIDTTTPYSTASTTIYVRVETKTDPNCFNVISFNLVVKPSPILDNVQDQYVCTQYTLPALVNPGTYYSGTNQGPPMLPVGTSITTNTTVYVYHETGGTPSCSSEKSFRVIVVGLNDITPADIARCDSAFVPDYPLPGTHYFTNPGGPGPSNTEVFPGTLITALGTTTLYVYFIFTDPTCPPIASDFDITITKTPTISSTFNNVFDCNAVNSLPTITTDVGTGNYYTYDQPTDTYTPVTFPITTTTPVYAFATNGTCRSTIYPFYVYIGGLFLPNVDVCTPPYILNPAPVGEYRDAPNGGGNIIAPGNIVANTRVYTYVPGAACTNDDFFDITFHQPTLTVPTLAPQCDSYTLPTNPEGGRYFTQTGGPSNASNMEYMPGHVITATETIYIYKESTMALTPVCYNEVQWTITINPKPVIDSRGDQIVCYSYTLTSLINGNYFEDPNGVNPIVDPVIDSSDLRPGTEQTTRVKRIYIYAANPNDPTCFSENSFTITLDGIEAADPGDQTSCDSYTLPNLPANNFYYDASHMSGGGNLIAPGTVYNASTSSPIFIYTESNNRFSCKDENSFNIIINYTPVLTPAVQNNIVACDSYTLQPLTVGKYYVLSGGPGTAGNAEIAAPITFDANNPPPAVLYAYADTGTTPNCFVEQPIHITLNNVTELPDVPATCKSYQLNPASLQSGENYYSSPGGVGLLAPNATITSTQTIYIYKNFGTCTDESDFIVNIVPQPTANPAAIAPVCDTYNDFFDGIYQFDLTQVETAVLGAQAPASDYNFKYFRTFAEVTDPTATPLATPTQYVNSTPFNETVWVRISNSTSSNACFAYTSIALKVNPRPEPHIGSEYFICEDHATGTLLNSAVINTGISGANFTFVWTLDGNPYGGNTSSITTNQTGTYTVTVTDTTTNCQNTATTTVTKYAPYLEIVYSDAFVTPSYITVNVLGVGSGNYEYQIDGGLFQDSNVFYDVTPGNHVVSVRDKDGHCSPKPLQAVIINYPKFFTPNGDGYNDTWNIADLISTNPNAPIYIFDRFGKLLKQITPSSSGWNGTYNGQPLPATDYWFSVEYNEKGESRIFRAHFALKR